MTLRSAPLAISILALLAGCSSLPDRQILVDRSSDLLSRSGEVISSQTQRLSELTAGKSSQREAEVEALFDQPYIDPLTRYLDQHEDDRRYARYLDKVAAERERRCAEIAQQYRSRAATAENLSRYRRGYLLSCPDDVSAFAERVEQARSVERQANQTARQAEPEAASEVPLDEAVSRRQVNNCYLYFTIRNLQRARDNCKQPATAGDAKAQHHMASLTRSEQNFASARQWAQRSAQQGYAPGQLLYAELLQNAQGGDRDAESALQWLQAAAAQGLPAAQYAAGRAWQQGLGTTPDQARSRSFWQQAAEQGHVDAQLALAESLLDNPGTQTGAARSWLTRAARQGSTRAQMRLAECYAQGLDGSADPEQAYIWYSLALLGGESAAQAPAEQLATQLNSEQLVSAQSRIRADHSQMPR
ncbi:MAG: sel1 repeat family protein [Gammaproteobacteria bacterium]|nr:sel1 repeat family protein [Gammaproteobacteria bacterium]